ncbi:MAG: hypothetical protein ACRCYO_00915 [Bacteroidia bacterium]
MRLLLLLISALIILPLHAQRRTSTQRFSLSLGIAAHAFTQTEKINAGFNASEQTGFKKHVPAINAHLSFALNPEANPSYNIQLGFRSNIIPNKSVGREIMVAPMSCAYLSLRFREAYVYCSFLPSLIFGGKSTLTLVPGIQYSTIALTVDSIAGAPPSYIGPTTHYKSLGPALLLDWTYDLSRFLCGMRSEYFYDAKKPNGPRNSRTSSFSFTGYFGVRF